MEPSTTICRSDKLKKLPVSSALIPLPVSYLRQYRFTPSSNTIRTNANTWKYITTTIKNDSLNKNTIKSQIYVFFARLILFQCFQMCIQRLHKYGWNWTKLNKTKMKYIAYIKAVFLYIYISELAFFGVYLHIRQNLVVSLVSLFTNTISNFDYTAWNFHVLTYAPFLSKYQANLNIDRVESHLEFSYNVYMCFSLTTHLYWYDPSGSMFDSWLNMGMGSVVEPCGAPNT